MTESEEVEYLQGVLDKGATLLCNALGINIERYDQDQAIGECYMDCFRDVAKVLEKAGYEFDEDEWEIVKKSDPNQQLKVELEGSRLNISIGTELLAHAVTVGRPEGLEGIAIENPKEFLKDLVAELSREREDGSTLIHEAFDRATEEAIEVGSSAVNYEEVE